MTTAYTWVASPEHEYEDHPERPGRLTELETQLDSFGAQKMEVTPATLDEIARVHSRRMIQTVKTACAEGGGIIDYAPTFVTPTSFDDALLASGGTLNLTRAGEFKAARKAIPADALEAQLLGALSTEPKHVDEIRNSTGLPIEKVSATLTLMELKGMVRQVGGMNYVAVREEQADYST